MAQQPLSLQEALGIAREKNLTLLQQQETEKAAALRADASKTARLPSLEISGFSFYLSQVPQIDIGQIGPVQGPAARLGSHVWSNYMLSLRQPIFTGFEISSKIKLAETARLSEQAKRQILTHEILHKVHLLFYQRQSHTATRRVLEASLKRLEVQLQNVRNLLQAGQVMAFDTLQVHNQKLSLAIEKENVELQRRLSELQLARLLDLERTRPIAEIQLKEPSSPTYTLAELKQRARETRPELETIRLALRSASLQKSLAQSAYYPTVSALANFHVGKPGVDPVANEWMDFFTVAVNVQWNLWRWGGDRKQVEAAEAEANRLSYQERELLRTIEYEVAESYESLLVSWQEIALAENLVGQQAERFRIVSVQHQNGVASTNDLITAETDLTRSELQYQLALLEYFVNEANLKLAVGTITQEN